MIRSPSLLSRTSPHHARCLTPPSTYSIIFYYINKLINTWWIAQFFCLSVDFMQFISNMQFIFNFSCASEQLGTTIPSLPSYGYPSSRKKIDIHYGRVGVIIGKSGETIKYLQVQFGVRIQVTRDMDDDPHSHIRPVEIIGTHEQISKAEQLIHDVLSEVGLIIGKGGDTTTSTTIKRTVHIDGTKKQIELAKQLVNDVTSEVAR